MKEKTYRTKSYVLTLGIGIALGNLISPSWNEYRSLETQLQTLRNNWFGVIQHKDNLLQKISGYDSQSAWQSGKEYEIELIETNCN